MNAVVTRFPVAKKRTDDPAPATTDAAFGRIELQADPEWITELDRIAKKMGMNRSAYLRSAANRQMAADRIVLGEKPEGGKS